MWLPSHKCQVVLKNLNRKKESVILIGATRVLIKKNPIDQATLPIPVTEYLVTRTLDAHVHLYSSLSAFSAGIKLLVVA